MAHMLSLTASSVSRPTTIVRGTRICPAGLRSRGVNGQVFAPAVKHTRRTPSAQVVRASRESELQENAEGFLAHKGQQKTAYGLLTAAWAAVAIAKLFFTQQFFSYVFDITNPHVGLLGLQRLAGFSSLAPAVAAYTLAKAASGDRLDSHTYLRQNLGLAVAGTVTLFYLWKTPATVLNAGFQKLAAGLATATAVIAGAVYTQTSGFGFNLTKISKGFYSSVLALLSPDNSNAAVYSFISAALGIYSAVLLFGPHELASQWLTVGSGEVSLYLQREIGLSTFLAAVQTYCLKDAADRKRMGRSTFKNLNLGLATIAAGNASALWWAVNTAKMVDWTTQSKFRLAFLAVQVVTYAYNWIESDRDEDEQINKIESAFDNATDSLRDVAKKGERKAKELWEQGEDKFEEAKHKGKKYADKAEDEAEDIGDKAKDKFGEAKHKGQKYADKAEDEAEDLGDKAKGKAEEVGDKGKKYANKAQDEAEDLGDEAESKTKKYASKAENEADRFGDKAKHETESAGREAERFEDKAEREAKDTGKEAKGQARRRGFL
ncbi:TPA: hypothetical protein ACH3X2_005503 [Trebouxia sp. C0005]